MLVPEKVLWSHPPYMCGFGDPGLLLVTGRFFWAL